jgi:hypothetical protein
MVMTKMVAGAFDDFASAQAAAGDLRGSGIGNVQITTNSKNPDGEPGTSLADEAATLPGIVEKVVSTLFNANERNPVEGQPIDEIRVGGIVVSVTMGVNDNPEVVRAILTRHQAVLLGDTQPGVSII